MESQFTVLFDADVFYRSPVRDLLVQLAAKGLFRGRWTNQIHDEWIENLLKNRPNISRAQLERTRELINSSVLGCLVTDYEELMAGISLPDPNDVHVLAAAIRTQAQVIVTYNTKDFPPASLLKYGIEPQHPDTFLRYQMDLNLPMVLFCVKMIRARLKNPQKTAKEYLQTLFSQQLPQTVDILRQYANLI
jgi:predicted nucleic acid-binding protein